MIHCFKLQENFLLKDIKNKKISFKIFKYRANLNARMLRLHSRIEHLIRIASETQNLIVRLIRNNLWEITKQSMKQEFLIIFR